MSLEIMVPTDFNCKLGIPGPSQKVGRDNMNKSLGSDF